MLLDANVTWFNFFIDGSDRFAVYAFTGEEEVHKPYEFTIELVSKNSSENINELIGKSACLTIADRSGYARPVHGVIRQMEQLHTANYRTHYKCSLVPRLWFLDNIVDHRIFQHKNVLEIITQILCEQGFADSFFEFKLFYQYQPREYCVQYGESDLHFISRICEEEGIYFYFEHTQNNHKLCFCDRENGPDIPGESGLRYYPGSGTVPETATISRLTFHERANSNSSTYREWNFTKPLLNQQVSTSESGHTKAPVPEGMKLEQYHFPHLYQEPKKGGEPGTHGEQYVAIQLLRQLTFSKWIEGEADVTRLIPSYVFNVHHHPRDDVNVDWWVVRTIHSGEQPQVLEHESPERGLLYNAKFTAIPRLTRFIPILAHPKKRIEGIQSAIVTGPEGEEVYTDKYGRVKIQFHWDRIGKHNENSCCWVRASAGWAGNNFGCIQLPRIGQEVLVEYLEGDPDRPIITGRVYYELNMPPWQLAEQKALSGIQSREFKADRRNQLVLDDTTDQIQAQLSSDHQLSQINLGYITRINHIEGRADFRGEGFELRTDGWGAIRAAQGIYLGTDSRPESQSHHKDISEAIEHLQIAEKQHSGRTDLAVQHNAHENDEQDTVKQALKAQNEQVRGEGQPHTEFKKPHIVLSSPAGIEAVTPESMHLYTGQHLAVSADEHISITSGKSILGSALEKIRFFAYKMGIKIFAAKGKVEIQAQSNDLEIIAQKVLRLISTQERIEIAAAKEIFLVADGSYIKINGGGIEHGTLGQFNVYAADHSFLGAKSAPYILPQLPAAEPKVCKMSAAKNKTIFY